MKHLRAFAFFTLCTNACATPDEKESDYTIRWIGSAYDKGDAFKVEAQIRENSVDLTWDGFSGDTFDFMSDKEKPRTNKTFSFDKPNTVAAFRVIAEQSGQGDIGGPSAIGQGVSVEMIVTDGSNKLVTETSYFATPANEFIANKFAYIPWSIKGMMTGNDKDAEEEMFCQSIESFALDLSTYGSVLTSIENAYVNGAKLPNEMLKEFACPQTYEQYQQTYGPIHGLEKKSAHKMLKIIGSSMRDCFKAPNRVSLLGAANPTAYTIVVVDKFGMGWGAEMPSVKLADEYLSADFNIISTRSERLLLDFISGSEGISKNAVPLQIAGRLDINDTGELAISASYYGSLISNGKIELRPEMSKRLGWLNDNNISRLFSIKRGAEEQKNLEWLRFNSIQLHPHDDNRVKFDYAMGGKAFVIEAHLVNGNWSLGKRWNRENYYSIEGVYHNDSDFRPDNK